MKFILMVAMMMTLSQQALAETLLSCRLSDGDTTEAVVIKTKRGLLLKETLTDGRQKVRPLSENSWNKKRIRIRAEIYPNARALLFHKDSKWTLVYKSLGYSTRVSADCKN